MKRIIISSYKASKSLEAFTSFIKRNLNTCILFVTLMIGVVWGAVSAKNANDSMLVNLDFLFNSDVNLKLTQSILQNFIASFSSHCIFVFVSFFLGFSLWGFLIIPIVVFFRGFGTGLSGGYLCARYGVVGFAFNSFVLLPGILLSSIAVLIIAKESINFSIGMLSKFSHIKFLEVHSKTITTRTFLMRTGVILILIFFAALLDVFLTYTLSGVFDFNSISNLK